MKAHQPFFSIIIASYNRAELLKRALHSLLAQTETDWEAIIIDDGSTDDTYLQILPFLNCDNKINYQRTAHEGAAQSKNKGLYASSGKYISFLDSDDEYRPEHLQYRKSLLLENPTVKFLYGGLEIIGNQYVPDRFDYSRKIHINDCVAGGTFFIERNTLILLNGFSEVLFGEDADLFERATEANVEMKETNISSYIYHHETMDSLTNKMIKGS
jgi:glycosyltransferase involved in cell wall biosynthesis